MLIPQAQEAEDAQQDENPEESPREDYDTVTPQHEGGSKSGSNKSSKKSKKYIEPETIDIDQMLERETSKHMVIRLSD